MKCRSCRSTNTNDEKSVMDEEAVKDFQEYLRIPSVHPNINYDECLEFLKKQASGLELPYQIFRCAPDKPIFVITWKGNDSSLPSIWLNSHMDVVPVFEDKWTYKPFGAQMDAEGNIYGRGAQDMKCVGIQHLQAIKRLKKEGVTLKRTIHIAFVPDEETAAVKGMKMFAITEDFRKLNVGFALDEGMPSPNNDIFMSYGERTIWQIRVHCPGQQGHGSLLLPHPPGDKIGKIVDKFNEYRARELKKLSDDPKLMIGDVTTINLTKLEGGVQANVVPPEFSATFDIRICKTVDLSQFEIDLNKWCKEAGDGVWFEFIANDPELPQEKLDSSNTFWVAFKKATDDLKIKLIPIINPGATDARYIRQQGIPALGFSPMPNTILRAHDNDEYLNKDVFLKGIDIFKKIIEEIANVD